MTPSMHISEKMDQFGLCHQVVNYWALSEIDGTFMLRTTLWWRGGDGSVDTGFLSIYECNLEKLRESEFIDIFY